jgi:menaquinone-dependent protoporphyrinogen oxidase
VTRSRALVVFHTVEGRSAGIAAAIATELCADGIDADLWRVDVAPSPVGYDGVVAGDSIHATKHSRALRRYLRRHQAALATRPHAQFQMCPTPADPVAEHGTADAVLVDGLVRETGLAPDLVVTFPGRPAGARYGRSMPRLVRWIAGREGDDTEPSCDDEYTDWDAVRRFAADAAALIGQHAMVR